MKLNANTSDNGSVLICVLGSILILSLVGANVLFNTATRLNVSTNQVRAWKESLLAAESGSDIAFAEIQTHTPGSNPATWWSGWTQSGTTYTSPQVTFGANNLVTQAVVDECYWDATGALVLGHPASGNSWYRVRSKGTAPLPNLKRTGINDAVIQDGRKHFAAIGSTEMQDITARGKGDNLLRKIDFQYDHFVATYGPNGDGLDQALVPATAAPSISRRIERFIAPMNPYFDAAIKTSGSFYGLGSAAYIDSYDSKNGAYDPTVKTNPSSPFYGDSHYGGVEIASATATVKGDIYGSVATDGGAVYSGSPGTIYGTIDNNVPFSLDNYLMPSSSTWKYVSVPTNVNNATTVTPPVAGTSQQPNYYLLSSISNALTVNPAVVNGNPVDTYVAIHVTGDISGKNAGITVNPQVHLKIYFDGNIDLKARNIINNSPNTPGYPNSGPYAGNLKFYGISPTTPGQTQSVVMDSGGGQVTVEAAFYAPSADVQFKGAPDFYGFVTAKTFYANGNITWHYDRALNDDEQLFVYREVSYIEDPR